MSARAAPPSTAAARRLDHVLAAGLKQLEIEAKNDRTDDLQEETLTPDRPESPVLKRVKVDDLSEEAEAEVIQRALAFGFAALPAPASEEAFWIVFLITVNRVLEGYGILETALVDDFDVAANEALEYLSVIEAFPLVEPSAAIGASPFDNFTKFKQAKRVPFPEESMKEVATMCWDHILNMVNFNNFFKSLKNNYKFGKAEWKQILDLIKTAGKQLVATFANNFFRTSSWARFDAELLEAGLRGGTRAGNLARVVDVANNVPATWRNPLDSLRYLATDIVPAHLPATQDVANWATSQTVLGALGVARSLSTTSLLERVSFYVSNAAVAVLRRFIDYRYKSIQKYLEVNGRSEQKAAKEKLVELVEKTQLTPDNPLCKQIGKALAKWKKARKRALKTIKDHGVRKVAARSAWDFGRLMTNTLDYVVPDGVAQPLWFVVELGFFQAKRNAVNGFLISLSEAFRELANVEMQLEYMPRVKREEPLVKRDEPFVKSERSRLCKVKAESGSDSDSDSD